MNRRVCAIVALAACMLPLTRIDGSAAAETPSDARPDADLRPLAPIPPASTYRPRRGASDGALSDRIVSYRIRANLDPAPGAKRVTGSERVTWRNPGDVPVSELWFHLYLNAFRDELSTFMRGSGGQLRGDRIPADGYGSIEVTAIRTPEGVDLLPAFAFVQPDDGNENDRTVARVSLPEAVAPGESVSLDVEFVSKLPRVFARTGYKDNFFFVAQWFPKLGVYEPRGMRGRSDPGWNCHQFHPNSEFYADFGTYDVEITTPSNFVVGATGRLEDEARNADGTTTRRYRQDDVHDFAWTADDNYIVGRRVYVEAGFPDVEIVALVQPEHAATVERHLDACAASIGWFNRNIGTYPYSTLTVVDPETGADGAGGMEYPTLITAGIVGPVSGNEPAHDDPLLELVIFHEFGHQYWYGMVASNEFEEPWMDEGINSYTESLGLEELWPEKRALYLAFGGKPAIRLPFPVPVVGSATRFAALPQVVRRGPVINTSWGFAGEYSYGVNSYYRTAIVLQTLRGYLGAETMDLVMRAYFERWRFGHPTSQDFFDVASEVSGQDLSWFFDQFLRSDRVVDYGVQRVTRKAERGGSPGETVIILEREGDGVLPTTAHVTFEDGSTERIEWDGRAAQATFTLSGPRRVTRVDVDPDRAIVIDANFTNNSWVVSSDSAGPFRIASQIGLFFQHLLLLVAGIL